MSATKPRGPKTAWAEMLRAFDNGEFNVLVSVNLDRLLRAQRDLSVLIERGILIRAVEGEIDLTSAFGEFQATVATPMAAFEVRRKAERQIRANDFRAQRGLPAAGTSPLSPRRLANVFMAVPSLGVEHSVWKLDATRGKLYTLVSEKGAQQAAVGLYHQSRKPERPCNTFLDDDQVTTFDSNVVPRELVTDAHEKKPRVCISIYSAGRRRRQWKGGGCGRHQ